jgi:inosine-uridine nucleoside N-ribohydrolase
MIAEQLFGKSALVFAAAAATVLAGTLPSTAPSTDSGAKPKIPVILDTDIGDDIDDTWALAILLKSPELDLKLVVGDNGNAIYRAKLLAKFLQRAGRTDVPVGIGLRPEEKRGPQSAWIEGYDLKSYPGKVHEDGVKAIIDTIMSSTEPVTVIAIGPVPNLAAALERQPEIAKRAHLVGMHGSVRKGYNGGKNVAAEYNVKCNPKACQKVFTAPWDITITPLDTCGIVRLKDQKYRAVRDSKDPIAVALIENYRAWSASHKNPAQADSASSILFDTVAVYLACSEQFLTMEKLGIRVTDDGFTVMDDKAKAVNVAAEWKDLPGFEDLLVKRLTSAEGAASSRPRE